MFNPKLIVALVYLFIYFFYLTHFTGISGALLAVMGSRFMKSGKIFPAGVVSLVSLVMVGGYFHGIIRSSHP